MTLSILFVGITAPHFNFLQLTFPLDQGNNTHSHWHMNMCIDNDANDKHACSHTWARHFLDCTRHGVEQSQWLITNMMGCKICLQANESGDRHKAQTQIDMSEPAVRPKLLYAKKEQNRFYPGPSTPVSSDNGHTGLTVDQPAASPNHNLFLDGQSAGLASVEIRSIKTLTLNASAISQNKVMISHISSRLE